MPQICLRIKRNWREEHYRRLAQSVGSLDGDVQSWIIEAALSALHPVNHAIAFGIGRTATAHGNARVGCKLLQFVHAL